jgi:hypothetical protein
MRSLWQTTIAQNLMLEKECNSPQISEQRSTKRDEATGMGDVQQDLAFLPMAVSRSAGLAVTVEGET